MNARAGAAGWTILCDFDGTISTVDVTDRLLEAHAAPGWEIVEARWARGEIGSRECLAAQVALLDMSPEELEAQIAAIDIDPAFARFVAAAQRRGMPLAVVSDGLDSVIRGVLRRHALGDLEVRANRLERVGARAWRLAFPHADAACTSGSGHCKCAEARRVRAVGRVLYVGDGASDFCVSARVDRLFAKGRLLEHARSHGIACEPIRGFEDALAALARLAAPALDDEPA
jgi:2,3-diketo-5-methylthio-1-phosphopentane phosphatase